MGIGHGPVPPSPCLALGLPLLLVVRVFQILTGPKEGPVEFDGIDADDFEVGVAVGADQDIAQAGGGVEGDFPIAIGAAGAIPLAKSMRSRTRPGMTSR